MIDLFADHVQFLFDGSIKRIGLTEVIGLFAETDDFLCEGLAAFAALGPDFGQSDIDAELSALGLDQVELFFGIGRESVDGHDAGETEYVLNVVDVLQQVGKTFLECLEILVVEVCFRHAAVIFQSADSSYEDNCAGMKVCQTALDIKELLCAEVGSEACLCDGVVTELECHSGRGHAVAAVCDVGEGTAVDKGGSVLKGLYQVGLEGILQEGCHGAFRVQIMCRDGLSVIGVGDDGPAKAGLEVCDIACQAEDRHDLGSNGDLKTVFSGNTLHASAEAVDNISELAVVHVDCALPGDLLDINAEGIALLDVVVEHSCEQVVCCADGMEVTGKMQVDVLHGDDLCIAAACSAALDAEDRAERGLAERDNGLLADSAESVCKTDAGRGLAFACRGGGDRCHQDQFTVGSIRMIFQIIVVNLCLVMAVLFDVLLINAKPCGNLGNLLRAGFLRNLNVCFKSHVGNPPCADSETIFRLYLSEMVLLYLRTC